MLLKKNKFLFVLVLILCSCQAFFPVEPVKDVNDTFQTRYGSQVGKAKKKHLQSIKNSNYNGEVSFENTAYGRLKQQELDFLEANTKNNPYIDAERAGAENINYLSYNAGPYKETEDNIFDTITIPKNDFKYYNLGKKNYNEVSNIELQESYDYIEVINKERLKQIEIARLKEEEIKRQKSKDATILDKTKSGLKTLTDKIKSLIN